MAHIQVHHPQSVSQREVETIFLDKSKIGTYQSQALIQYLTEGSDSEGIIKLSIRIMVKIKVDLKLPGAIKAQI